MASFEQLLEEGFGANYLPAHLGVTVLECGDGKARMLLPHRAEHLQNLGMLQGGVTAALIDITLAWAVLSAVHPRQAYTIDLTVTYLRPVGVEDVECEGVVLRAGRSVAAARAEVSTSSGVLVASGSGSFLLRTNELEDTPPSG